VQPATAHLAGVPGFGQVRGRGLHLGIDVSPGQAPRIADAALDGGVIVNACTPDTLRLAPPLILEEGDMEQAVPVLEAVADLERLEAS